MAPSISTINIFACILTTVIIPTFDVRFACQVGAHVQYPNDGGNGRRLTKIYSLKQGPLQGLVLNPSRQHDLQNVEVFLGIPYAAPPLGHLRFMPPVTAIPWRDVKKAMNFAPVCPQMIPDLKKNPQASAARVNYMARLRPYLTNQSEDCLYLNVYVPENDPKHRHGRQKFPVLVFIHGESFEWNSGNPYDGSVLASYGNIMIVTINFRLGILGFMKPNITEHPIGNFGLLDQVAALQWLKENVRELGGDPNSVTLMGHGTGAACVNLLMVSPVANGLFHRAILMSGSALADWALATHTTVYTLQVVQSLNCPLNDVNLTKCLQGKSLRDILSTDILAPRFETSFGPIIDGTVVPSEPSQVMSVYTNLFSKYELLYGVTELESYHELGGIALAHGLLEGERDELLKQYARAVFPSSHDLALSAMLKEYTASHPKHMPSPVLNRDCVLDLLSDAQVVAPLIRTADYHSKTNKASYLYVFGHNSENSEYAPLVKSVRGEELAYVFGIPLGASSYHFRSEYTSQEKLLSEAIMLFWTNFAKRGNPNSQRVNSFINLDTKDWQQYYLQWPEYDYKSQSFIRLDIPPRIETHYRSKHMKFWNDVLPSMLNNNTNDFDDFIFTTTTTKPKSIYSSGRTDRIQSRRDEVSKTNYNPYINHVTTYGKTRSYPFSTPPKSADPYREIKLIKTPARPIPSDLIEPIDKKIHMRQKPQSPVKPMSPTKNEETKEKDVPIKQSGATLNIIMGIGIIFLLTNIVVFTVLFVKKRKLKQKEQEIQRKNLGHSGNNTDIDSIVNPKRAHSNLEEGVNSGCNVFKLLKAEDNFKPKKRYEKVSTKYMDVCKTPKSDDSGGFGQRFKLRRHLSSSTLDAHTKVRDWIANEIIQRCSPRFMRKNQSNVLKVDISKHTEKNSQDSTLNKPLPNIAISETDNNKDKSVKKSSGSLHEGTNSTVSMGTLQSKNKSTKDSEKTTSTSVIGSQSSVMYNRDIDMDQYNRHDTLSSSEGKQDDMIKKHSNDVPVAVNATPETKTKILPLQRPIELSKSFDFTYNNDLKINVKELPLRRSFTTENFKKSNSSGYMANIDTTNDKTFKTIFNFDVDNDNSNKKPNIIQIMHKHSISEPVKDINYKEFMNHIPENTPASLSTFLNIKPPTPFENDINVTSKDESIKVEPLSAAESLLTIQRRNFPKVLPDFPKPQISNAQKRLSLPPQHLTQNSPLLLNLSFRTLRPEKDGSKSPPQPPPRTTSTLDRIPKREIAYDRSITSPISETRKYKTSQSNKINLLDLEKFYSDEIPEGTQKQEQKKQKPTVIIASDSKKPSYEPKIIIKSNSQKTPIGDLIPGARVVLDDLDFNFVDDFPTLHNIPILGASHMPIDFTEQLAETNLIRELIGGIDDKADILDLIPDTKGPATMSEKQHEMVKINTNPTTSSQKNYENPYYGDTVLSPNDSERTANIKQKFSLNKLQNRSDSISCPVEKSLNLKGKGSKIPKPPIFSTNIKKDKKDSTVLKMLRPKTDLKKKKIPLRFDSPSREQSCSESSNESKSSSSAETVKRIN